MKEAMMLARFAELKAQDKTLLVCSHEWGDALLRCDRRLLLSPCLIANDTPQAAMTMENIQQAYGENIQTSSDGNAETCYMRSSL
ncbi:MAG: hypothetical protein F6J95_013000 [Leptolyngbya sp. SIO1E4]|nr:hypothetical protein [Leptolyngbya sp. SIO1E4]